MLESVQSGLLLKIGLLFYELDTTPELPNYVSVYKVLLGCSPVKSWCQAGTRFLDPDPVLCVSKAKLGTGFKAALKLLPWWKRGLLG